MAWTSNYFMHWRHWHLREPCVGDEAVHRWRVRLSIARQFGRGEK
jgi:hypothetical protein